MAKQLIYGACPLDCPDTCGVITTVENGRAVDFQGDPAHPITRGWLCAKVRPYLDHVYHADRLTHPLRRVGSKGGGKWERISWEEAIAEIVSQWQKIITEYGPEAILPYSFSGTLGLVQLVVCNGRFWNRLGASQLERSICGAAAAMAVKSTLGGRLSPPYSAVGDSKLVMIWGHNPVSTAPHFLPFLRNAQRLGSQLVVIDPRRTRTANGADWHLAPLPGTDGALALGISHILVTENLHDEGWLDSFTIGWPEYRNRLQEYPPDRVSAITGIAQADLFRLARLYGETKPALIKIGDGINRNLNGGQTTRAICTLPALTGQYGIAGGGLSYSFSDYLKWDDEAVNKWQECPPPGRWVNMNRLGAALLGEISEPPIKSLYVFAANPAASAPNSAAVIAGLKREDLFTVVHELYITDTADYADIVLPATSQMEHTDLHKAYGHTYLSYNQPAIAPLGKCKSNWDVMRALAHAMGFQESWLQQDADEVISDILLASSKRSTALEGINLERLKQEGTIPLNLDNEIPFYKGRFPTPSGKVELYSTAMAAEGVDPLPQWNEQAQDDGGLELDHAVFNAADSLTLITGANHFFVSSSLSNQEELLQRAGPSIIAIHPGDAAKRFIKSGDQVIVENGRGWVSLRAVVSDEVRPGVLSSSKGRWHKFEGGRNINWTTSDALADLAGQSVYHSNRVWIRRLSGADDTLKLRPDNFEEIAQ